ncbi:hypothetical protein SAMN05216412_11052 [Nitrosospira multiformis]|uniref:Uncharacterized protein n=1 Tax=Nitrosospira multiformis TaxID=1231 RepID=A0A1I0FU06_9PROT|nr:hypothetical protein [Nitrosospira multiformis]SET61690.1 hypothetical protein SAMN05216412_11052 [Nitrosospira multiformis]
MNIPAGFNKEALRYVADALETESKTVEVDNATDYPCHPESAPAQAARFIRAVIADAPMPPAHSIAPKPFHVESLLDQEDQSMDWWQDTIKNALGAAHEHYQERVENASTLQTQNSEGENSGHEMWQLASERDSATEWADKLAHAIAERLGIDIGELSNASNPWQRALDYCEMPAQEIAPHEHMLRHVASHNGLNASDANDKLRRAAEEVVNFLDMDVNEEQLVDGLKLLEGAIENLRDALKGKS